MLRDDLTFFLHSEGEMKPLNPVMTPQELGLTKGTSLLVRNWSVHRQETN